MPDQHAPHPRVLVDETFKLGEGPLYDDRRDILYWTDIPAGELWRCKPDGSDPRRIYSGPQVGGFTLEPAGDLLLFREDDVALLDDAGHVTPLVTIDKPAGAHRFNDVIAAPHGGVFAGLLAGDAHAGGLYHLPPAAAADPDNTIKPTLLFSGSRIPNGLGFTPDNSALYWTDSVPKTIHRFTYDPDAGEIGDRATFWHGDDDGPTPDGLDVDENGHVWSARWGGACICEHTPDGRLVRTIELPTDNITSCVFGGPDLATLYVTSAGGPLYALRPGPRGRPAFRSRITG
mgnify:FL=1